MKHAWASLALGLLLLAGCTSPDPALYVIAPVTGAAVPGGPKVVVLRQIGLARYLDRPQIVRSSESYRLDVAANEWWGEPLGAMIDRILIDELSQRLPGSTIYSETGAVSARPDAALEVNIQRLDADAAGNLVLSALADARATRERGSHSRSIRLVVPMAGSGTSAEVAAASLALGQLADELAAMLRAP